MVLNEKKSMAQPASVSERSAWNLHSFGSSVINLNDVSCGYHQVHSYITSICIVYITFCVIILGPF